HLTIDPRSLQIEADGIDYCHFFELAPANHLAYWREYHRWLKHHTSRAQRLRLLLTISGREWLHLTFTTWDIFRSHQERLTRLPKAKVAMLGYDTLFPKTLVLAMMSRGIHV